jgi:hypothetical protein
MSLILRPVESSMVKSTYPVDCDQRKKNLYLINPILPSSINAVEEYFK